MSVTVMSQTNLALVEAAHVEKKCFFGLFWLQEKFLFPTRPCFPKNLSHPTFLSPA